MQCQQCSCASPMHGRRKRLCLTEEVLVLHKQAHTARTARHTPHAVSAHAVSALTTCCQCTRGTQPGTSHMLLVHHDRQSGSGVARFLSTHTGAKKQSLCGCFGRFCGRLLRAQITHAPFDLHYFKVLTMAYHPVEAGNNAIGRRFHHLVS